MGPVPETTEIVEAARRRRGRNVAVMIALLALCGLFYAITIVKLARFG
jgi:hypothetical protein